MPLKSVILSSRNFMGIVQVQDKRRAILDALVAQAWRERMSNQKNNAVLVVYLMPLKAGYYYSYRIQTQLLHPH